ncbi:hypothetical protein LO762_00260 [Actinocorallia sp. API 0066]|uniref:hypothetical protein n=1 Tax=Actinocorallia sp. API 0066 TaxID=2896846 RepID=UPI001E5DE1B8|nr:hypothetical protein [Actinocorallia sp. API 0066]MCD0447635.1 hypothetical protein [Actinocorallia sp. API 0066]
MGLAAALVVGVVAVPGTASAAPKACALGTWTLTKHALSVSGDGFSLKTQGGKGTKLTIAAKSVKYDFSKTARVTGKASGEGITFSIWTKYSKTLTVSGSFKGKAKGTFLLKPKTAKGTALAEQGFAGSTKVDERYKVATAVKKGDVEPLVLTEGKFTCSKKALRQSLAGKSPEGKVKIDLWYKR